MGNNSHWKLWNDELQDPEIFYHLPVICWEITKIHQSCSLERHSAKQTQKVTFPLPVHLASSLSRDLICLLEPQFSWDRKRSVKHPLQVHQVHQVHPDQSYLVMRTSMHLPLLQHEPRNQVTAVFPPFVFGFLSDLSGKPWTGQNLRRMQASWFYQNLV